MGASEFDSVVSFSQSLSQWSVLIIGGVTALLLGNSHISPTKKVARSIYLLFLPSWGFLLWSIFMGVKVQRNFLALKLLSNADVSAIKVELNHHMSRQLTLMETGLCFIGAWLLCYLIWWVFCREEKGEQ